jgi:hypothetical protein
MDSVKNLSEILLFLPLQQPEILLATSKFPGIDVVLMQELQVEVAKRCRLLEDLMCLVSVASTRHHRREVVAGVI